MIFHGTKAKRRSLDDQEKIGRFSAAVAERRGSESGFTLIEVMIAVFILVTALLGIISTTVIVIQSNTLSKTMTTATTLARDRIETLKNTSFISLPSVAAAASGPVVSDSITYTRTCTAPWLNNDPSTNMRRITVSVVWNWRGANHTVNLESIAAGE